MTEVASDVTAGRLSVAGERYVRHSWYCGVFL